MTKMDTKFDFQEILDTVNRLKKPIPDDAFLAGIGFSFQAGMLLMIAASQPKQ